MSMIRNLLAVIAGIASFVLLIMAVQWLGHQVYTPPELNPDKPDQIRAYLATMPVGAILFVGASYMLGAFGGTLLSGLIGTLKASYFGGIIGGLVLAFTISNLLVLPHPLWFNIAAPIAIVLASYAAVQVLGRLKR